MGASWVDRERMVLIVDGADGALGDAALQLVRLGVDAMYSNDVDEAALLARQERDRLATILVPANATPEWIEDLLSRVARHAGLGARQLAILGPQQDESWCQALKKKGIRWRLWAPFDEHGLRLVALAPMSEGDDELRIGLRVPVALDATVLSGDESRQMIVGDLTTLGAYLDTRSPFPVGADLTLEIQAPTGPVEVRARVRWTNQSGEGSCARRHPGMGVEFVDPDRALCHRIQRILDEELKRYSL
jgi:hypothetical protein